MKKSIMLTENVITLFLKKEEELQDKPCLRYKSKGSWKALSWTQLKDRVESLAFELQSLGIQKGDRVAILSNTRYEWTLADLAILSLGAVTVPIYHSTLTKDVEYLLQHAEAKLLFVEDKLQLKKVEAVRERLPHLKQIICIEKAGEEKYLSFKKLTREKKAPPSFLKEKVKQIDMKSMATIVYTSGTTGQPKGVVLTHQNLTSEVEALLRVFSSSLNLESLLFLPLAHILARAVQFFQLTGGFVQSYAESIDKLLDNLQEIKPHFMACVPRIFEKIHSKILGDVQTANPVKKHLFFWALNVGTQVSRKKQKGEGVPLLLTLQYELAKKLVFSKLHHRLGGRIWFFISGGAPLSAEVSEFFHAADILILEGYGLTETTAAVNCNSQESFYFGSVGLPLLHVEEKIAEDGEILVRGPHVFQGYYRDEKATREAFTPDGFFKTGDIGEFDAQGFLKITDRKKDLIVTAAGKNIAPQPIENFLKTESLISQVMVHGDRRKFLSALITLNAEELKKFASDQRIPDQDYVSLTQNPKIYEWVRKKIEEKNKQLPSFETIKRFAILNKDFTIEEGELTPTLKVKRKILTERYKDILDSFYQE